MLYEKSIPQNDSVFRAHNECMKECHEETGALGSYLARKEEQNRSKDMLANIPTALCVFRGTGFIITRLASISLN